jgi:hypothetical protein
MYSEKTFFFFFSVQTGKNIIFVLLSFSSSTSVPISKIPSSKPSNKPSLSPSLVLSLPLCYDFIQYAYPGWTLQLISPAPSSSPSLNPSFYPTASPTSKLVE